MNALTIGWQLTELRIRKCKQITYFNWMGRPRLFNQQFQDPTELSSRWLPCFIPQIPCFIPQIPACYPNPEQLILQLKWLLLWPMYLHWDPQELCFKLLDPSPKTLFSLMSENLPHILLPTTLLNRRFLPFPNKNQSFFFFFLNTISSIKDKGGGQNVFLNFTLKMQTFHELSLCIILSICLVFYL